MLRSHFQNCFFLGTNIEKMGLQKKWSYFGNISQVEDSCLGDFAVVEIKSKI